MAEGSKYCIVSFNEVNSRGENQETVEVVPSSWFEHNKCFWPPKSSKTKSAVKKCYNPDPSTWCIFDARVIKEYGSYNEAREHLKESQYTSDLSSMDEQIRSRLHPENNNHSQNLYALPPAPSSVLGLGNNTNTFPSQIENVFYEVQCETVKSVQDEECQTDESITDNADAFKEYVVSSLADLKIVLSQHGNMLQQLMNLVKHASIPSVEVPEIYFDLPCSTSQMVLDLENSLKDASKKKALEMMFSSLGGKSMPAALKLMTRKLMLDEVACCFSLKGQKKKFSFQELQKINDVFFNALKMNSSTKCEANVSDMEKEIAHCLKQSSDRVSQRKKSVDIE